MALNKEQLETFEKKLLAIQADIDEQLQNLKNAADFGDDTDHLEEETDESEELVNTFSVQQLLKERKEAVLAALDKIKNGGYGICEHCGAQIDETVLTITPESKLCKECKRSAA